MKIVFMGTPQPAVPTLDAILENGHEVVAVWTQPDRPAGRGRRLSASPVNVYAAKKGLPIFQPEKIRNKESRDLFRSHKADIAVVVAYGRILTASYLSAFPHGAVNVHFSLLPKYRGAAPVNWAIVNGESVTGVTTMKMDRGLDTGDILVQTETEIGESETSVELMDRLSVLGAELLVRTLHDLDILSPVAQDHEQATFAPLMSKADGHIDWSMTDKRISDRIRGFQPFPRSYTNLRDQRVTFWKAHPLGIARDLAAIPGEILTAEGSMLTIACGDRTTIRIEELQIEGKRRMSVKDFLNGVNIKVGDTFG